MTKKYTALNKERAVFIVFINQLENGKNQAKRMKEQ